MESHHRASNPRGSTPVKPMPSECFRRHYYRESEIRLQGAAENVRVGNFGDDGFA